MRVEIDPDFGRLIVPENDIEVGTQGELLRRLVSEREDTVMKDLKTTQITYEEDGWYRINTNETEWWALDENLTPIRDRHDE